MTCRVDRMTCTKIENAFTEGQDSGVAEDSASAKFADRMLLSILARGFRMLHLGRAIALLSHQNLAFSLSTHSNYLVVA